MTQKEQIAQLKKEKDSLKEQIKQRDHILDMIGDALAINGDNILRDILKLNLQYNDIEHLENCLMKYIMNLDIDVRQELVEYHRTHKPDDEEEKKSSEYIFNFFYIKDMLIDKNIGRVEKKKKYNHKKSEEEYFLRIYKKYDSESDEFYDIQFESEEERDKQFDILKGKLKIVGLNTL